MRFVTLEEARVATEPKLVVAASLPSPWSEAAKGILHVKRIDAVLVRFVTTDAPVREWMGWHNVPVLLAPGEPMPSSVAFAPSVGPSLPTPQSGVSMRTHWADILEWAERKGGPSLLPRDDDERARLIGLAHELLGENGLVWSGRLLVIHRGLETEGKEGFALRVANYLAPKYGYAPERIDAARARVRSLFDRFAKLLEGKTYALGDTLSALDIYLAAAMSPFAQMPEELCPGMHPAVRHAFATAAPDLFGALPPVLRAHRDRIYEKHLELPVRLS